MHPSQILVAYITRAGYTRRVATAIAQRLREQGHEVDLADLELAIRHPEQYDAVVLGCATRFGHPADAMARFVHKHRRALATRPTGYFSVDGTDDARAHLDAWLQQTAWRPTCVLTVPGIRGARLRKALEWLQDRLDATSIKHVQAPTDWERVRAFADDIARLVAPAPSVRQASP